MGLFTIAFFTVVAGAFAQDTTTIRYVFDMGKNVPALDAEAVIDLMAVATPGVTFPLNNVVPNTGFNCAQQGTPGYFADPAPPSLCQAFYRCDVQGNQTGFLCPNQTLFNQLTLTCDYYFNVDCAGSRSLYNFANSRLYQPGRPLFDTPPKDYVSALSVGVDVPMYPSPSGRDLNGGSVTVAPQATAKPVVVVVVPVVTAAPVTPAPVPATAAPTLAPTAAAVTAAPTAAPTEAPATLAPTAAPTDAPVTDAPTAAPETPAPTASPAIVPDVSNSTSGPAVIIPAITISNITTVDNSTQSTVTVNRFAVPVEKPGLQGWAARAREAVQAGAAPKNEIAAPLTAPLVAPGTTP